MPAERGVLGSRRVRHVGAHGRHDRQRRYANGIAPDNAMGQHPPRQRAIEASAVSSVPKIAISMSMPRRDGEPHQYGDRSAAGLRTIEKAMPRASRRDTASRLHSVRTLFVATRCRSHPR
jgi:hypothetical protein